MAASIIEQYDWAVAFGTAKNGLDGWTASVPKLPTPYYEDDNGNGGVGLCNVNKRA